MFPVEMKFHGAEGGKNRQQDQKKRKTAQNRGRKWKRRGAEAGGKSSRCRCFPREKFPRGKSPYRAARTRDSAVTAIGTAARCGFTGETFTRPKTSP